MPYITPDQREALKQRPPMNAGELNYVLCRHIGQYVQTKGISYETLNSVIGVLECVKFEIERRILAGYEDMKRTENGEVFSVSIEGK